MSVLEGAFCAHCPVDAGALLMAGAALPWFSTPPNASVRAGPTGSRHVLESGSKNNNKNNKTKKNKGRNNELHEQKETMKFRQ